MTSPLRRSMADLGTQPAWHVREAAMDRGHARQAPDRTNLLPEIRLMLENAEETPTDGLTAQQVRAIAGPQIAAMWGAKDNVDAIEDFIVPNGGVKLRARLYRTAASQDAILFFHGGGWVVGDLDSHDGAVRALTKATGANILSIEYRKAPEAPHPAAIDDAEAALDWLRANSNALGVRRDRFIVAGDSAGANISAVLALRARDRQIELGGQILVYPATDLACNSESRRKYADGFFLTQSTIEWYLRHYLSAGTARDNPSVSPLYALDLSQLAPTLLVTADHDPLRDEGRLYAQRLIAAGNDVCYEEWRGVVHGFFNMDRTTPATRKLITRIGEWAGDIWDR